MGWKSTIDLTREEAINLIILQLDKSLYEAMSNNELSEIVENLGYGDDPKLPYCGYNFLVVDKKEDETN